MPDAFSIFVAGSPQPAGSKRAVPVWNRGTNTYARAANGRPIIAVMDDAKHSRGWKDRIHALAKHAWGTQPLLDENLVLSLVFVMPRPQSHYGTRRGERYLRDDAPRFHRGKPDTTKLVRACEDALNGVVWIDDSRVVEQHARKVYGLKPGVHIRVALVSADSPSLFATAT